jgi:hypothetical protein
MQLARRLSAPGDDQTSIAMNSEALGPAMRFDELEDLVGHEAREAVPTSAHTLF